MNCPECHDGEVIFDPAGIHCIGCGWSKAQAHSKAQLRALKGEMKGNLSTLLVKMRDECVAAGIPDDLALGQLWLDQLQATAKRHAELSAAVERNTESSGAWKADDPRWPKLWRQHAAAQWAWESWLAVESARHVLICPNHPPDAVSGSLSHYGLLMASGSMSWCRYCEECSGAGIDAEGRRLWAQWQRSAA